MPAELRPQSKRKLTMKPAKAKRIKAIPTEVVEEKLKILEQKEKENPDDRSVKGEDDSDDDLENVSLFRQLQNVIETSFNCRKKKRWKIKRWTRIMITLATILIMAKTTMMKMIILMRATVQFISVYKLISVVSWLCS